MSCFSQIPELLIDAEFNFRNDELDQTTTYALLDRAHALRERLRHGLLTNEIHAYDVNGEEGPFDKLGLYIAGLLSLEQLIKSLRPVQVRSREAVQDKTGELCAQLLNLELRASDTHPPTGLSSAFKLMLTQHRQDS